MQNVPTTPATVTNKTTTAVTLSDLPLSVASPTNQTTTDRTIDQATLVTTRIEGLWVSTVFPWQLALPWTYAAIIKSNTQVTNL